MKKSEHSARWMKAQEEISELKAKIESLNFSTGVIIEAKNKEIADLKVLLHNALVLILPPAGGEK